MRRKHSTMLKRTLAVVLSAAMAIGSINWSTVDAKAADRSKPWILSTQRPAYSSSVNGGDIASFATDGNLGTQWGAAANLADQWLDIDLGGKADISKVVIDWQNDASYGVAYQVLVSDDEINWTKVYETTNGTGGNVKEVLRDDGTVDYKYYEDVLSTDGADGYKLTAANGRYVRVLINYSKSQAYSDDKKSGWGASIREIEVYGIGDDKCIDPISEKENIALGKEVTVTSYSQPWWASTPLQGSNAVDGDYDSYWLSEGADDVASKCNQSLTVDLGRTYTIGRVLLQWQVEYGNIWDLQVSADGENWKTVYRQLEGNGEDEDIRLYQENVRYVRMQGILMGRGSGYSIREIQIYEYDSTDEKINHTIGEIPKKEVVNLGKGSYVIDDANLLQPREPKYVCDNVDGAYPTNDWWTSIIYTKYSDTMPAAPLVYKYSATGLGMYYADGFYTRVDNGGMGADSKYFDVTVGASNITGDTSAKLYNYGDWSVDVAFSDDDTPKMVSTLVKGSPYAYTTFSDPSAAEINVANLVKFMDGNGNEILNVDGQTTTLDSFVIEAKNESEAPGDGNKIQYHYYGVYLPAGTQVTKVGNKLKLRLGSNEDYLVVGALCVDQAIPLLSTETVSNPETKMDSAALEQFNYMYKHAYSYVTDTVATYNYNEANATMTTTYKYTIDQKRTDNGIANSSLMCMMPHQWKYSTDSYVTTNMGEALTYVSVRGDMRIHEGNDFSYSQKFNGIIPQYTTPDESNSYNEEWMYEFLEMFTDSSLSSYWVADPYWQGKKSHPIAMGILIAEQLGEYETRDRLIGVLKKILENWLTYDGEEDYPYYMYYHTSWGAISGDGGDHGMAINLSDHHFLWAYFIFPAAVVASYDDQFVEDYGPMVELLIRDAMNPDKNDEILPYMRNFDVFEGHSWAGGYGDNNSGNNQESASEATFAWAGLYLWGLVTENKTYRDAGIWGFTSEVNAIEQYWFNMDQGTELDSNNWAPGYGTDVYGDANVDVLPYIGMVWGLGYTNGTYFSGNPCCIMGIHLLPVTPAITYMGYRYDTVKRIWNEYEQIQVAYQKKIANEGAVDPEGWYHILWPFMALSDAEGANSRFANEYTTHINENGDYMGGVLSTDEMFNTYWYIQNMCAKGYVSTDIWSTNYTSYQVFEKNGTYTAEVWNPFDYEITVQFANENGYLGSVKVPGHATVDCDPTKNEDKTVGYEYVEVTDYTPVNTISGVVEAEDYYTNFSCEVGEDAIEGEYIGWIDNGDSLLYTIDVQEEADYIVDYRVQCVDTAKNSAISLKTDNDEDYILTTKLDNSTTEWKNVVAEDTIHLKAGKYQMKLRLEDGGFNLNYVKIYKVGTKAPIAATDDLTKTDLSSHDEISLNGAEIIDVSSEANTDGAAAHLIDGDYSTRWESVAADPQYFTIDLKEAKEIGGIKLYWEGAASKNYVIQTSNDNSNWTTVFTQTKGLGGQGYGDDKRDNGLESIAFETVTTARYVRLYSYERLTGYGVSLYEVRLFDAGDYTGTGSGSGTGSGTGSGSTSGETAEGDVALNKDAYASSQEGDGMAAKYAVDGNDGTRWASEWSDNQWIYVDLGKTYAVNKVDLTWEGAYAKDYKIQTSSDASNWTTVKTVTDSDGGDDSVEFATTNARYVRMLCVTRATGYGCSLWNFEVYTGKSSGTTGGEVETETEKETETEAPTTSGGSSSTTPVNTNLALNKNAVASAIENDNMDAANAVDGNKGTRYSSDYNDGAWMYVDLGQTYDIDKVVLTWEGAYGKAYDIQVSTNGDNWTTVKSLTEQDGGEDVITFNTTKARFVKMQGVERATGYGYSLWEMEVYNTTGNSGSEVETETEKETEAPTTNSGSNNDPSVSGTNVALNKTATASSQEGDGMAAKYAVDGNLGTRWASEWSDGQWLQVDLGQTYAINKVVINWEGAYGKAYNIEVSTDGNNWQTAKSVTGQDGGEDTITFDAKDARYVRINGVERGTGYGYSIWELQVIAK